MSVNNHPKTLDKQANSSASPVQPLSQTWLSSRSIKTKLKTIIMFVSTIGILLAGTGMLVNQWIHLRSSLVTELSTLAEILADNSKSAVSFGDKYDATEVLNSLANQKPIVHASIFVNDASSAMASYSRSEGFSSLGIDSRLLLEFKGHRFTNDYIELQKPIYLNNNILGYIYLRSDLSEIYGAIKQLSLYVLFILFVVQTLAYMLASQLQNFISKPLVYLAQLARQISEEQDYSLRAQKQSKDELGDLTDDFNTMLQQVELRDNALRESERRFHTLIEQAADALYLCDMDGNILHVNNSACQSLGYSKTELFNMNISQIDSEILNSQSLRSLWGDLKADNSYTAYSHYLRNNGEQFPVELHFGLLSIDDENCVLSFARDITERKLAEEALKKANDELESKVEIRTRELSESNEQLVQAKEKAESSSRAKSEFLANMSHEIRTPMNAVMGFTELLQNSELTANQQAYVSSIQSGAKGLMTIINDVLDLSKIEAGKMALEYEPVNSYNFVREIEQIFNQTIQDKNLEFEILIQKELPKSLIFDQGRVRQILFNLIGNAIKFTHEGHIHVHVLHKAAAEEVNHHPSKVNLSFSVEDTGIGVKQEQQDLIFEQFTQQEGQSTREYGGTGLGLSICKKLAKIMGGSMELTSKEGVGSTFTLNLNDIAVSAMEEVQPEAELVETDFDKACILVVDDVAANRILIKEQFRDTKLEFIEAKNGIEAIEMAKKHQPDLIIMDVRMPKMDGITATQTLKKEPKTKTIPVIALTASVSKTDKTDIESNDFCSLLHKPAPKREILEAFRQFLTHKNVASQTTNKSKDTAQTIKDRALNQEELESLTCKLQQLFDSCYQDALSSGLINDIVIFAHKLNKIGQDFDCSQLTSYSQKIQQAAEVFDIDKIEGLMSKYSDYLSSYSEQLIKK